MNSESKRKKQSSNEKEEALNYIRENIGKSLSKDELLNLLSEVDEKEEKDIVPQHQLKKNFKLSDYSNDDLKMEVGILSNKENISQDEVKGLMEEFKTLHSQPKEIEKKHSHRTILFALLLVGVVGYLAYFAVLLYLIN